MFNLSEKLKESSIILSYKDKDILDCELKTYAFHKYKKEVVNND